MDYDYPTLDEEERSNDLVQEIKDLRRLVYYRSREVKEVVIWQHEESRKQMKKLEVQLRFWAVIVFILIVVVLQDWLQIVYTP